MADQAVCKIDGCGKPAKKRGWCYMHYTRWQRNGDAATAKRAANGAVLAYIRDVVLPYTGDDCMIWPFSSDHNGYGKVWCDGRMATASRLVCEKIHGPPPTATHEAAHCCGKGHLGCVSPRHLLWKTPKENAADKLVHGTGNRGEKHGMAKLSATDVLEIRRLGGSRSPDDLAEMFGISKYYATAIQRGKSWSWLK